MSEPEEPGIDLYPWLPVASGQNVTREHLGVLAVHRETGIAAVSSTERSRLANRGKATKILRHLLQYDLTIHAGIVSVADEAFGPFPVQTPREALMAIERGIFDQRQRILAVELVERQRDAALKLAAERFEEAEELHAALGDAVQGPRTTIAALRVEVDRLRFENGKLTAELLGAQWTADDVKRLTAERDTARGELAAHRMLVDSLRDCDPEYTLGSVKVFDTDGRNLGYVLPYAAALAAGKPGICEVESAKAAVIASAKAWRDAARRPMTEDEAQVYRRSLADAVDALVSAEKS